MSDEVVVEPRDEFLPTTFCKEAFGFVHVGDTSFGFSGPSEDGSLFLSIWPVRQDQHPTADEWDHAFSNLAELATNLGMKMVRADGTSL